MAAQVSERAFSVGLLLAAVALSMALQFSGNEMMAGVSTWSACARDRECLGEQATLRIASALGLFFCLCAVASKAGAVQAAPAAASEPFLGGAEASAAAAHGSLRGRDVCVRLSLLGALLVVLWFLPSGCLDGLAWVLRAGAFCFAVLQQIILIDFAYLWNDEWCAKAERRGAAWLFALLAASLLMLGGALAGIVLLFLYYGPRGCAASQSAISVALLFSVACTALQLRGRAGSLLTSATVACYLTFLAFGAVSSWPEEKCNGFSVEKSNFALLIGGLSVTLLSLAWIAMSAATTMAEVLAQYSGAEGRERMADASAHLNAVLAMATAYIAMLLTDWATGDAAGAWTSGKAVFWMQFVSMVLAALLYLWTLVAPVLFPERFDL